MPGWEDAPLVESGGPAPNSWDSAPLATVKQPFDTVGTVMEVPDGIKGYLGVPYKFGGEDTKRGIDCSAFTQQLFSINGVKGLPRTANDQWQDKRVPANRVANVQDIQPGDQLFFQGKRLGAGKASHTGYFAGWDVQPDGSMVPMMYAASSAARKVVKQRLDKFLETSGQTFLGAKRYRDFQHTPETEQATHVTATLGPEARGKIPAVPSTGFASTLPHDQVMPVTKQGKPSVPTKTPVVASAMAGVKMGQLVSKAAQESEASTHVPKGTPNAGGSQPWPSYATKEHGSSTQDQPETMQVGAVKHVFSNTEGESGATIPGKLTPARKTKEQEFKEQVDIEKLSYFNTPDRTKNEPIKLADALSKKPNDPDLMKKLGQYNSKPLQSAVMQKADEFRIRDNYNRVLEQVKKRDDLSTEAALKILNETPDVDNRSIPNILKEALHGPEGARQATGWKNALEDFGLSFTDPQNAIMMIFLPGAPKALQTAASLYFGTESFKSAKQLFDSGDYEGASVQLGMGAWLSSHGVRGGVELLRGKGSGSVPVEPTASLEPVRGKVVRPPNVKAAPVSREGQAPITKGVKPGMTVKPTTVPIGEENASIQAGKIEGASPVAIRAGSGGQTEKGRSVGEGKSGEEAGGGTQESPAPRQAEVKAQTEEVKQPWQMTREEYEKSSQPTGFGDWYSTPDGKFVQMRGSGGIGSQRVGTLDAQGKFAGYYNRDDLKLVRKENVTSDSANAADEWLASVTSSVAKLTNDNQELLTSAALYERFKKALPAEEFASRQKTGKIISDKDYQKALKVRATIEEVKNKPIVVPENKAHKQSVEQALAEGKPVPPEVLAEYPDLAKPAKTIPESTDRIAVSVKQADDIQKGLAQDFEDVNHTDGSPTGFKARRFREGVHIYNPETGEIVTFKAKNNRSGSDAKEAQVRGSAYAIDNAIKDRKPTVEVPYVEPKPKRNPRGFNPAKPEQITQAAYKADDGTVTTGAHHPGILKELGIAGYDTRESRNTPNFGFVTESGKFLTRPQAAEMAKKTGQDLQPFDVDEKGVEQPHSTDIAKPGTDTPISETKLVEIPTEEVKQPWHTDTPYTPELINRYNNYTHFEKNVDTENARFVSWRNSVEENTKQALAKYGVKEIPEDVRKSLDKLYQAEYEWFNKWVRAREIAPPVSVVGPARYSEHANVPKSDKMMFSATESLNEAKQKVQQAIRRHSPNRAISSDNPKAVEELQKKLEQAQLMQTAMVEANKIYRNAKLTPEEKVQKIVALGISEDAAKRQLKPDFMGRIGFPDYATKNNNANIRRMQSRIEDLNAKRSQTTSESTFEGGKVVDNVEANRIQIIFDEKPHAETLAKLKSAGFHWSPREGAWQRMRGDMANLEVERITGQKLNFGGVDEDVSIADSPLRTDASAPLAETPPKPASATGTVAAPKVETPKVIKPTQTEVKAVKTAKAQGEKVDPRTGMTKTQAEYAVNELKAAANRLQDTPDAKVTVKIPDDGQFTVNKEQALNLAEKIAKPASRLDSNTIPNTNQISAKKVIELYGGLDKAIDTIKRQIDAMEPQEKGGTLKQAREMLSTLESIRYSESPEGQYYSELSRYADMQKDNKRKDYARRYGRSLLDKVEAPDPKSVGPIVGAEIRDRVDRLHRDYFPENKEPAAESKKLKPLETPETPKSVVPPEIKAKVSDLQGGPEIMDEYYKQIPNADGAAVLKTADAIRRLNRNNKLGIADLAESMQYHSKGGLQAALDNEIAENANMDSDLRSDALAGRIRDVMQAESDPAQIGKPKKTVEPVNAETKPASKPKQEVAKPVDTTGQPKPWIRENAPQVATPQVLPKKITFRVFPSNVELVGKEVILPGSENVRLVVAKAFAGKGWYVYEPETGMAVSGLKGSEIDAMQDASLRLRNAGKEKTQEIIAKEYYRPNRDAEKFTLPGVHPDILASLDRAMNPKEPSQELYSILDLTNKYVREEFTRRTGVKLPSTQSGTKAAIKEWMLKTSQEANAKPEESPAVKPTAEQTQMDRDSAAGKSVVEKELPTDLPNIVKWALDLASKKDNVEVTEEKGFDASWTGRFKDERSVYDQLKKASDKGIGKFRSGVKTAEGSVDEYTYQQTLPDGTVRHFKVVLGDKTTISAFDVKPQADTKSKGHVDFIGPNEFFYGKNGDLFKAPANSPLDVDGYRMGARFESTKATADQAISLARKAFEPKPTAPVEAETNPVSKTAEPLSAKASVEEFKKQAATGKATEALDAIEKAATERIRKRMGKLTTGIDPLDLADYALIGATRFAKGTIKFAEWSAEMVKELGEEIKPHLNAIWNASQTVYNKHIKPSLGDDAPIPVDAPETPARGAQGKPEGDYATGARKSITEPEREARNLPPVEMQLYKKYGKAYLEGRAAVIDGDIKPDKLAEEVANHPRVMEPKEVGSLTFDRQRNNNKLAKAYAAADAAIESGDKKALEDNRKIITETLDALDMNDQALKRGGREASAALSAFKQTVKEDYSLGTLLQKKRVKEGRPLTLDEQTEVRTLKEQLDKANADLEAHNARIQAQADRIKELETQRAVRKAVSKEQGKAEFGKKNTVFTLERKSAAVDRLRAKFTRVSAGVDPTLLADAAEVGGYYIEGGVRAFGDWAKEMKREIPGISEELIKAAWTHLTNDKRLAMVKKRLEKQTADINERIAAKDTSKPIRPPAIQMDTEAAKLTADRDAAKIVLDQMVEAAKPISGWERARRIHREFILSGFSVIQKLLGATAWGYPTEAAADAIGAAGRIFPAYRRLSNISGREGAPIGTAMAGAVRGGRALLSREAAVNAYKTSMLPKAVAAGKALVSRQSVRDAWNSTVAGINPISTLAGVKHKSIELGGFVGSFHGAEKAFLQTAEFHRSGLIRTRIAAEAGLDIHNPEVQATIFKDAALDAWNNILQGDNRLSALLTGMLGAADRTSAPVGLVGHTLVPITRVSANILGRGVEMTGLGLPRGAYLQIKAAMRERGVWFGEKGVKTPTDAAHATAILKAYKYGGLGLVGAYLGWNQPSGFQSGGWYTANEKRQGQQGLKPDELRIAGVVVPKVLAHSPFAMAVQFWATMRRGFERGGVSSGTADVVRGISETTPGLEATKELATTTMDREKTMGKSIGTYVRGVTEPQMMQQFAKWLDSAETRKPQGFWDELYMGVPKLREQVPQFNMRRGGKPLISTKDFMPDTKGLVPKSSDFLNK